jgi:hypothetical protein
VTTRDQFLERRLLWQFTTPIRALAWIPTELSATNKIAYHTARFPRVYSWNL